MTYKTRPVTVGNLTIGGGAAISIQSMTTTDTRDVAATVAQIKALERKGCEIVRVAVPDEQAAAAIGQIKRQIAIPLVADIHFNYKLALLSIENGVDKVRLNPGNIGNFARVKSVVDALKDRRIPLRIGVNSGSIEKRIRDRFGGPTPAAMVESALAHVALVEKCGYDQIVISLKSSSVIDTVEAYRAIARQVDYPLHLGVTEVGTLFNASIKSAVGVGSLLLDGIGDTLRISVTGDPLDEIDVAKTILRVTERRQFGINVVACPTCGRCNVDLLQLVERVERELSGIDKPLTVAVMGCAVNGPGEAREADIGLAGGVDEMLLFVKGKVVKKLAIDQVFDQLKQLIDAWEA